jgi:CRP/FNR family transcriptional regulator, nitrogen oxide reductase regulator
MKAEAKRRAGITNSQTVALLTGLNSRFLEGLSSIDVRAVMEAATKKRFAANSLVVSEGDPAEHMFLMLDGGARHYTMSPQGKKIVVLWIRPGELIGGAALLSSPREYFLSSEAVTSSTALTWDRATIRALAAKIPRLVENALLLAYDYLVHYRIRHVAASCQSAPQRLAQVLGYLAKEMGQRVPGGVELQVRNEELAHEANVTIFTVSRLMVEWEKKGLLTKGRGKVVLRLPEELIQLGV